MPSLIARHCVGEITSVESSQAGGLARVRWAASGAMFRQGSDRQRMGLTSVAALVAVAFLMAACSILMGRKNPSTPYASQPTGTPTPNLTGTVEVQQTQTAAPVATMFARLDSTACARSTIWALTPSPILTPTPTRDPISADILEDFPLEIGVTWVYSVTFVTGWWYGEKEDPKFGEIRSTGLITETVTGREQIENTLIFTAALSGILVETMRPWGQITSTVIYTTTKQYENKRLYKMAGNSVYRDGLEVLREPLKVGLEWAPFGEEALEDVAEGWYVWRVEEQRNMMTQAGVFQGCLYLVLWTAPDHSLNWFCPGVGFVSKESHHHGTPGDQYWELREIRRP